MWAPYLVAHMSPDLLIQTFPFLEVTWLFALEEISIGRDKDLEKSYKEI